jgi:nitrogen fixation protein FixH
MSQASARAPGEITGRHVLFAMLAFLGIVIAANVVFIVQATRTFPGEIVKKSYVQGLQYNATLEERRRQEALGWEAQADFVTSAQTSQLEIRLRDRSGAAVESATLQGVLRRPLERARDIPLAFRHVGGGVYLAPVGGLAEGQWELSVRAQSGDDRLDIGGRLTWPSPTQR